MTSTATTVGEYLNELPSDRKAALVKLRALIHRIAPDAAEEMKYGMPSFGDLCAIASQKNYMSFYVCEGDIRKTHRARLAKLDCGKGCIRFKRFEKLPLKTLESILAGGLKTRHQRSLADCKDANDPNRDF